MRRWLIMVLSLVHAMGLAAPQQASFDHAPWGELLSKHVVTVGAGQATQADYAGFAAERGALRKYLDATSAVSRAQFDSWSPNAQLAFLINAYNAWTVELVLTRYPQLDSIKDLGSFLQSPWKRVFIPLLGQSRSLDEIEHELIRGSGRYKDPRIHFAVNCASVGCPALRPEAFAGERLDAQLEDAARRFLSDRSRNRYEQGELKVSSIFKWYREDFEHGWRGSRDLAQFLVQYRQALGLDGASAAGVRAGSVPIRFLDYDWRLNDLARNKGARP